MGVVRYMVDLMKPCYGAQAPAQLSRVHETPSKPVVSGEAMSTHPDNCERPGRVPRSIRRDGTWQALSAGSPLRLHAGQSTGAMHLRRSAPSSSPMFQCNPPVMQRSLPAHSS